MDRESQEQQLTEEMQEAHQRYLKVTAEYDGFLSRAHESGLGRQAMVDALKKANAVGPKATEALKDYHAAVAALARFYQQA
jgi:hypothetical protein